MRILLFMSFILVNFTGTAQEFHPYGVKSGKITYEIRRFITRSGMKTEPDGKMISKEERIPYVSEVRTYYWDDYGNVARLVAYKVSGSFGKPLPQKQKLFEQLWKGNHRYYYNGEKVEDDPNHMRIECLADKKLFNTVGWFKLTYPKAEKVGTDTLAGKICEVFRTDVFSDVALWKNLVLRDVSYYTNPKGERKGLEQIKIATKVTLPLQEKPGFFEPEWLKNK